MSAPGRRAWAAAAGVAAATAVLPVLSELRLAPAEQRRSARWRDVDIAPRGATLLGVSLRTPVKSQRVVYETPDCGGHRINLS